MATGFELPQMKSIWLDEDEEAEKLYAQQLMGSDEEEAVAFKVVNSTKPLLENKENIELTPLNTTKLTKNHEVTTPVCADKKSKKKKKGFLSFFKGKEHTKSKKISTPFGFQHISHANTKHGFESSEDEQASSPVESPSSTKHSPLNKAFVTESIPSQQMESLKINDRKRASMISRRSVSGSISTASSSYSRTSAGRIVSSSTMATSVHQETSSPSRLTLLNAIDKSSFKDRPRDSKDSDVSLDFLRNYDFPTLLEQRPADESYDNVSANNAFPKISPIIEVAASDIDSIDCSDNDEKEDVSSLPKINRRSSDSRLLETGEADGDWLDETISTTRRSVDDILLCYHIPSDAGSFIQSPISSPVRLQYHA